MITQAQGRNIRHDAAEVAQASTPFTSRDDGEAFLIVLNRTVESDSHPAGFGLDEEWVSIESYTTGRSSTPLSIPLPYGVWFPRVVIWCQALDVLKRLKLAKEAMNP